MLGSEFVITVNLEKRELKCNHETHILFHNPVKVIRETQRTRAGAVDSYFCLALRVFFCQESVISRQKIVRRHAILWREIKLGMTPV